jgi:hypothetical protein
VAKMYLGVVSRAGVVTSIAGGDRSGRERKLRAYGPDGVVLGRLAFWVRLLVPQPATPNSMAQAAPAN